MGVTVYISLEHAVVCVNVNYSLCGHTSMWSHKYVVIHKLETHGDKHKFVSKNKNIT